jgi:hypothetical protein
MDSERKSDEAVPDQAFDADGVDLTLIRWMLSLSPRQRLEVLQKHVNSVLRLRESVRSRS